MTLKDKIAYLAERYQTTEEDVNSLSDLSIELLYEISTTSSNLSKVEIEYAKRIVIRLSKEWKQN